MEKLELKHLAPYLPYGLKYCRVHQSPIDLTEKIEFVGEASTKGDEHNINNNLLCEYLYMKYLPILHPLSDLTKEIEVNGEKFVPNKKIQWLFEEYFDYSEYILNGKLCFNKMEKLFEWHFDVFGLIEKDLAIDINTIEL